MGLRIGKIIEAKNLKQYKVAAAAAISTSYLSQLSTGKYAKGVSIDVLMQIAAALDEPVQALFEPDEPIAVAGRVGAGARVELIDAYEKGDGLYRIACPIDLSPHGIVGVEVVGGSMEPMIREGDVLLFSRNFVGVDENDMGEIVICETEDGEALVKQIKTGREPNTFDLLSARDGLDPIYGARLKWAARLRRHIRKDEVEVIER